MLQNARVTAFTVSELLGQNGRVKIPPSPTPHLETYVKHLSFINISQ